MSSRCGRLIGRRWPSEQAEVDGPLGARGHCRCYAVPLQCNVAMGVFLDALEVAQPIVDGKIFEGGCNVGSRGLWVHSPLPRGRWVHAGWHLLGPSQLQLLFSQLSIWGPPIRLIRSRERSKISCSTS